ncbi:Catalytic RNA polymerase subunit [Cellulophaga phage phi14:2]|uniref:Structural protein n=1 Tax=Cellulophaga phage phi14:2 TaxID=1327990 RepID=S0A2C3_9CAUD|nr:Catalytic RNA polymerase subunit [Cellulophaga phage phi14:2]AGO48955.1 structural protein [Cellulophaga phage phi14:2]
MACKIENIKYKGKEVESKLGSQLIDIFNDLDRAKEEYDKLSSPEFIAKFGDWINDEVERNVNEDGEPLLIQDVRQDSSKHYFFILKNGERFDLLTREFDSFTSPDLTNEIKEITDQLSYYIYNKHFSSDFEQVEGAKLNIQNEISQFVKEGKAPVQAAYNKLQDPDIKDLLDYYDNIEKHSDEFESEIVKFFSEKKLIIKDAELEDVTQEGLNEGLQGGDLVQAFEKNSKDNATANVKLMLSFLPKIDNLTGEPALGDYLNKPVFRSFDSIHSELLEVLSDITTLHVQGEVLDVFSSMYNKIKELADFKKSFKPLLEILDTIDEQKKTEFVQAFYLSKINFYTTTIETLETEDQNNTLTTFKVQNVSNANNPISSKLTEYYTNFKYKILPGGKLNKGKLKDLQSTVTSLLEKTRKENNPKYKSDSDFYEVFEEGVVELMQVFEDLGVDSITFEAMDIFLKQFRFDLPENNAYKIMYQQYQGKLTNLNNLLKDIQSNKINPYKINPFKNYSNLIFNSLAEAENYFIENNNESTIFSNGKTYWNFARPSYISNRINTFKNNPGVLRQLLNTSYGQSSLWAKHLLGEEKNVTGDFVLAGNARESASENRLKSLELSIFNSLQEKDKGAEGNDNGSISIVDQLADKLNKVLRGGTKNGTSIYSTVTPGDKSTLHEIKIDHFIPETISSFSNGTMIFNDKIVNAFTDHFVSEVNRMKEAYQELETLPESKRVVHYHTDARGNVMKDGKLAGNAFKSGHILSELSFDQITQDDNEMLKLYNEDGSPINPKGAVSNEQKILIKQTINKVLNQRIKENIRYFKDQGLVIDTVNKDGNKGFHFHGLDKSIMSEYTDDIQLTEFDISHVVSDFTLNSILASIEYTKLFTGDPANYKNMVDFFKRVPATYTNGTNLRLGLEANDHLFDVAVLENIVKPSAYLKEIGESLKLSDLSEAEKKYILEAYEDVNQTDAQAWITPKRWAFLISRTGKWNSKYQSVYNKILKSESLDASEMKLAAQPLKGVYFGLVNNTPTYLKYSQAVLLPQLVAGTQLQSLADAMNKQDIGESIVLDGVKVGATTPNIVTDENGDILKSISLNPLTLSNADWKLQQDLPVKTIKPTLLGSQIQKNIYSSLTDEATYTIENEAFNGSGMFQAINDTVSAMSNLSIAGLSSELGKDSEGKIDKRKLYDMLEREMLDKGSAINLLKSIQKNLPIEAMPGIKDKLYNIVFSKINSAAVKLKTNGGSFIQLSNFGLDKQTADAKGITWLVEPSDLKPPVIEKDADGKNYIRPGQIFMSHVQIAKLVPDYAKMDSKTLSSMIDPKALRAIGYRIPNQGQSSNDPLQIVGILPEAMGDTIVAYTEIPTKTGSDFDIDKMYVMLPNFKVEHTKKSFKLAKDYIAQNEITVEEMYDELEDHGFNIDDIANGEEVTESAITEAFIKNHILNSNSELEYHNDFVKQHNIDAVNKIDFLGYSEELHKNKSEQLQNRLFDLYWAVLTNEKTYGDLITPIDFPHVKDEIKRVFGDNSKQTGENLKFHDPLYQLKLKFTYAGGKSGVGITANMLVDHNRSKGIDMQFNQYNLGVGHTQNGNTVFDKEYSEELNGTRFKIKDTISAFLNAFVDNAKDPYINDGNFNTYTSSVAFMLIRAGVHPDWIISFIGQPVLRELADFTQRYESKIIPKEDVGKSSFDIIVEKYETINQESYKDAESRAFSLDTLQESIEVGVHGIDLDVLKTFKGFQEQAKRLNESVQLSRFDTNGSGKNILDLIILKNKIKNLYVSEQTQQKGSMMNHFKKYHNNGKITSLGTQVKNTLLFTDDILNNNPSLFLLGSKPIQDLVNSISNNLVDSRGGSRGLLTNEDVGKLFYKEVYKYIMADFAPFKVGDPMAYIKDTIFDLVNYKTEDKQYDSSNFFIENMTVYENSFGITNKNKSVDFQDRLYRSAYDLMMENPELANKMFISSFLMNGFENKLIDIKEYIPYQWFLENDIRSFIESKNTGLKDSSESLRSFEEQFIKNNSDSNILAPKVSQSVIKSIKGIKSKHVFELPINDKTKRYILGATETKEEVLPNYVKVGSDLYRLKAYREKSGVYVRTNKLGFEDPKSFLSIKEYKFGTRTGGNFTGELTKQELVYTNQWVNENITLANGYISADSRTVDNPADKILEQNSLENILFSQNNVVSSDENDITKQECK